MEALRRKARTVNADTLVKAIGIEATELRRWINGSVNYMV